MKISILHLSDLHISKNNADWLKKNTKQMVAAVWNDFHDSGKIIIVVSGDIANAGTGEEYDYAKKFFSTLLKEFANRGLGNKELENKIICVPGNHDCNFNKNNQARELLLQSLKKGVEIDNSVFECISGVQNEYRAFAKDELQDENFTLGINNNISIKAGEKTILFRLYNTSWMSVKKEEPNSIVMPLNLVDNEQKNADFVISVFHHYYPWITKGSDDNIKRFSKHILQTSNMAIYGHEHSPSSAQVKDIFEGETINEFQGGALCLDRQGSGRSSSFNSFVIDLDTFECIVRSYVYSEGIYSKKEEETVDLNHERKTDEFRHNHEFLKSLKKMSIPLHNSENAKMTLDEFFVYSDLERMNTRQIKVDEDFTDSFSLLDDKHFRLVLLEGDNQSGKTSLLNMYYLRFVDKYMYPVLVNGKNIINDKLDKIIGKAFSEQYNSDECEKYIQYERERKILLVDNFDECKCNDTIKKQVIDKLIERFHKVIITTQENEGVSSSYFLMEKKETFMARIKPLGHVKRNELVKKFYSTYNVNASSLKQQVLLEQVKSGFDMVENFLGKEYMPSYPIYILSILLSNSKMQSSSLERTSYGYCYGALITCALMTCVDNRTKIDRYYNVLTSLAYHIYKKKGNPISEDDFNQFYNAYQNEYFSEGFKEIKENLLKCNLLRCTDNYYYKFSYNYIYYYLVAQYMSEHIHEETGQKDIMDLCENIHDEQKANILIFIAHHIKNPHFIEATQLALMTALGNQKPVTLDREDVYYKLINDLCESLKKETVAPSEKNDPEKEREKMLAKRDEREKNLSVDKLNPNDLPIEIQNMNKSLRSIEVVGQIVKNRQGSLPKTAIKSMVKEMYETAFRTISYFGSIIESEKTQLIEDVIMNKKEGESNDVIKKKIDLFFELTSLNFCLFVFSKVINSVGNKEMRGTFIEIANEIGTPAAKLVSFAMISCYSKIAVLDIKNLVEELKDNPVAMSIIRARVRSYLYNNYVNTQDRQKIIAAVSLNPHDSKIMANRRNGKRK